MRCCFVNTRTVHLNVSLPSSASILSLSRSSEQKRGETRLPTCAQTKALSAKRTQTHTRYGSGSLAAPSLLWKTSCLWAPEEMTALSLISLSSAQTSPNYSRCLPLRWHAHWIIDGRPAPVSLKASPTGTTAASGQDTCQRSAARLPRDSSLDYYSNSNLFSPAARC